MATINIAKDFTETPGGRFKKDGIFSGEEFFQNLLDPKFSSLTENEKLEINLDGGYGYPVSFLEEAFGGLSRKYGNDLVLKKIIFISNDEPNLINEIMEYIKNA